MSPQVVVGEHTDWFDGDVDADAAFAFALASNDPSEMLREGQAVPPLFTAALVMPAVVRAQRIAIPEGAISGATAGVHAEHQVVFRDHLRVGEQIRMRAFVHSALQTPAGSLVRVGVDVCDLEGRLRLRHYWSSLQLGGQLTAGPVGPDAPPHRFVESSRAEHLATRLVVVDPDQGFRFAGVSGDRPAHSISDDLARGEGHPRKILQGMCTFSLAAGAVVGSAAGGDPRRLARLAARFSRPCHPGSDLRVDMYDAGFAENGARVVVWEAESEGVKVVEHGLAEIMPAAEDRDE